MPAQPHRDALAHQQSLGSAVETNRFIERLPRVVEAPVGCNLLPGEDDQSWQVQLSLTLRDQAVLDAEQPTAYQVCAAAQHALGLAVMGF